MHKYFLINNVKIIIFIFDDLCFSPHENRILLFLVIKYNIET